MMRPVIVFAASAIAALSLFAVARSAHPEPAVCQYGTLEDAMDRFYKVAPNAELKLHKKDNAARLVAAMLGAPDVEHITDLYVWRIPGKSLNRGFVAVVQGECAFMSATYDWDMLASLLGLDGRDL